MELRKIKKVRIVGVTPLIQNKPEEYGFDEQWVEKKATKDLNEEALKKLYVNSKMRIIQPSVHIERALIEAGKKIRIKGQGKATYSKLFGSMISVSPDEIIHEIQDVDVFKNLVVIPSTKGRVLRCRPILREWALTFDIEYDTEIDPNAILEALRIAGRYVGIGDWRPDKKGKYGKFEVDETSHKIE